MYRNGCEGIRGKVPSSRVKKVVAKSFCTRENEKRYFLTAI